VLHLTLQWILFLLLWLVFAFQLSLPEVIAGAAASAMAVFALHRSLRAVPPCFEPRLRWFGSARHLPLLVVKDLWLMLERMVQLLAHPRMRGVWRHAHFRTAKDCGGSAQRALATLFLTSTPNSIVVHIDTATSRILLHELVAAPLPGLLNELQE
jgi:multisubunit Na+/H+ antiporter MnhE subunit